MPKIQRTFTREFKLEAVKLAQSNGKPFTQVSRDLGIADTTLHRWRRQFSEQGEQAFPGSGHQLPHDEEMRRLQRENELPRQERDILKKRWAPSRAANGFRFPFIAQHAHEDWIHCHGAHRSWYLSVCFPCCTG